MVSNLKFFRRDPQRGQDRGQGYYYTRTYKGKLWWSKYEEKLDAVNRRPKTRTNDVPNAEQNLAHKHDYKSGRKTKRRLDRKSKVRGYF